jgi:hypothetical protein
MLSKLSLLSISFVLLIAAVVVMDIALNEPKVIN